MQDAYNLTGGASPYADDVEIDLRQYATLIWHWSWLLILCAVAAGAAAYVASTFSTPIYQAASRVLINEARNAGGNANYQDILASQRIATTYAELMTRGPILDSVSSQLGLERTRFNEEVTDISVSAVRDTQLIRIQVEGKSPAFVTAVANTLPLVFIDDIQEVQTARYAGSKTNLQNQLGILDDQIQQTQLAIAQIGEPQNPQNELELTRLRENLAQYQNSYARLLESYESLRLTEAQTVDTITLVEPALEPKAPVRPRILLNTLLAAIVGIMLALGAVFLMEFLDDRVRSPEELTRLLRTTWLGSISIIPDVEKDEHTVRNLITFREPRHPIAEAYRGLRTNLQFSNVDKGLDTLLVSSANPGEGKTTTSANLAIVMAQMGRSVLLVDADLRRPVQHQFFNVSKGPGLTDAILGADLDFHQFVHETEVPNLSVITAGRTAPNPSELLSSRRMRELTEQFKAHFDMIIFDAPPVLAVTDAQILGQMVAGMLLVVDVEKTQRKAAVRAVELLRQVDVPIVGAVLNRLSKSTRGYYYYYSDYYYRDEEGAAQDGQLRRRRNGRQSRRDETPTVKIPESV